MRAQMLWPMKADEDSDTFERTTEEQYEQVQRLMKVVKQEHAAEVNANT